MSQQKGQACSILILLTNGGPTEPNKTVQALQTVNDAPLSVVIVDVSGCNFDGMQLVESKLNAAGGQGKLQFVCVAMLRGALDHISNQLVSFFQKQGIYPQPEAMVDDIVIDPYNEVEKLDVPIKLISKIRPP